MLRISVSKAGEVPRAHVFEKREITVGRTAANDLMISEPGVSSAHARVLFTGTEVTIIDLESTNGTFVNGTRIQGPYILAPRDEVYICAHRLEFEIAAGAMAGPNTGGRGVGMTSDPSIQPPSPAFAGSPSPSPAPPYPSAPPPVGATPPAFGAATPPFAAAPSPAFGGMPQSEPPPLGPPAPLDAGSLGGPPMNLGVPSAVGIGGPRPRAPDEPPTLPPPIAPISPTGPMGSPASLGAPTGAMTSAPSMPPPLEFSSPNLAADLGDLPPPVVAEAPARTGATLTPSQGGIADASAPPRLETKRPDTREPAANLEPIVAHGEPAWPATPSYAVDPPSMPPPVDSLPPPVEPVATPEPPPPPVEAAPPVIEPAPPPVESPIAAAPPPLPSAEREPSSPRAMTPAPAPLPPIEPPVAASIEPPVSPDAYTTADASVNDISRPFAPTRSSPSRPPGVPQVIAAPAAPQLRSSPQPSPVLIDPRHVESLDVDFTDLSALSGTALMRAACARVFAAVMDTLAPEDGVPDRDGDTRARARAEAMRLLQHASTTVTGIEVRPWSERIVSELCGLGALSARLAEPDVQEIFVHGPDRVLVRRGTGPAAEIDAKFSCPQAIEVVVRRLTGTNFGAENPIVDARTLDGADVYAVHESVASGGPVVNITLPSPSETRWTLERLLQDGSISPALANLLATCVQAGLGILVCAGPGARAFPLLAALMDAAPTTDRQVLVRPMSEPGLLPPQVVVLEGDGLVGTDGTTVMQALVRTAVGLRPDRLCLHETAGPEAAELLAIAGRGLSGVLASTRASTAMGGIGRLAALAGLEGGGLDLVSRTELVARSIEVIVCVGRFPDGVSRVVELAETRVGQDGAAAAAEIIGIDARTGTWRHTGVVPNFFATLQRRGVVVDAAMLGS